MVKTQPLTLAHTTSASPSLPPTHPPPSELCRLSLALICLILQCPFVGSLMIQVVRLANELKEGLC